MPWYHGTMVLKHEPSMVTPQSSTINHQSSAINHQPSVINHELSVITHRASVTNHQLSTSNQLPSIINHQSPIINHQSSVIRQQSPVIMAPDHGPDVVRPEQLKSDFKKIESLPTPMRSYCQSHNESTNQNKNEGFACGWSSSCLIGSPERPHFPKKILLTRVTNCWGALLLPSFSIGPISHAKPMDTILNHAWRRPWLDQKQN